MRRRACLLGLLASLACAREPASTMAPADPDATLLVSLQPSQDVPTGIRMEVSNPGRGPIEFCRYHTPFEGLRNDIFEVRTSNGEVLDYRGPMAKRAPPEPEDYFSVQPGHFHTAEVDLAEGYALQAGQTYSVRYKGSDISRLPDSPPLTLTVE